MNKTYDFGAVKPPEVQRYAEPALVTRRARIVWPGPSELGSHAMKQMAGCPRAFAMMHPGWKPRVSTRSGVVEVIADEIDRSCPWGPLPGGVGAGGATVYMLRGTLAHTILAHAFIRGAAARGEPTVVAGCPVAASTVDDWYTPEEAIEVAAAHIGAAAYTFALPAARRLVLPLVGWAEGILARERVLAVETQLAWQLDAPFAYTVRLDLVTQHRTSGLIYARDYKTSSDPKGDKNRRYVASAQLMGQDQMGARWTGPSWGGVRVVLISGGDKTPPEIEDWTWPRNPRGADLERGIALVQEPFVQYAGGPTHAYPKNPLYCASCPTATRQVCYSMG